MQEFHVFRDYLLVIVITWEKFSLLLDYPCRTFFDTNKTASSSSVLSKDLWTFSHALRDHQKNFCQNYWKVQNRAKMYVQSEKSYCSYWDEFYGVHVSINATHQVCMKKSSLRVTQENLSYIFWQILTFQFKYLGASVELFWLWYTVKFFSEGSVSMETKPKSMKHYIDGYLENFI